MKYLLLIFSLLYSPVTLAQNIEVNPTGESATNNTRTFSFNQSALQIQGSDLVVSGSGSNWMIQGALAYDISPGNRFLGALYRSGGELHAVVSDGRGERTTEARLDFFNTSDPTLDIRIFDNGRFVTRDNVVNFTFFEPDGSVRFSISNSTGSTGGEAVSEMIADPAGAGVLLYNPRINYGSSLGSRARMVQGEEDVTRIYESRNRTIKYADISEAGGLITLITESEGSSDEVLLFDRFGNEIIRLESSEELMGATLTGQAGHLTLFSNNRVQVYSIPQLERLGSASFRANIVYATYHAPESQILALSGSVGDVDGSHRLTDPEMHAVHLEKRSIARTGIEAPLAWLSTGQLHLSRTGSSQFLLTGLNRNLSIRTLF